MLRLFQSNCAQNVGVKVQQMNVNATFPNAVSKLTAPSFNFGTAIVFCGTFKTQSQYIVGTVRHNHHQGGERLCEVRKRKRSSSSLVLKVHQEMW